MPSRNPTRAFLSLGLVSALLLLFWIVPPADRDDSRAFDRTAGEGSPVEIADPCPEGAVRTTDGTCALPPREALESAALCDEGQASYAGACWEVPEEALRRILEENESRAAEATREGCPSAHVRVGDRCVPMVEDPGGYIDRIEEGGMCRADCPEGTACVGDYCIRPPRIDRSHWCPDGPSGLSEPGSSRGCQTCYLGMWFHSCETEGSETCLPACFEDDPVCECCN